jgi:lipoate-protein ligase A
VAVSHERKLGEPASCRHLLTVFLRRQGCRRSQSQPNCFRFYPLAAPAWLLSRSLPPLMNYLDLTLATPEENLACDEALLDAAEAGEVGELLRFWEPQQHFVVVGYANKVVTEVNVLACESRGVPILRRCSGGGTVLQGAGCLNYALVLKLEGNHLLNGISAANRFIMERNRSAIESALPQKSEVRIQGHTDLTLGELKFSGNSQRRRRHFLLFHGTLLLDFDIALVEALLELPAKQPDYRGNRSHRDFLVNLGVPAASVEAALAKAWLATIPLPDAPRTRIETLVREKYSVRDWTLKF